MLGRADSRRVAARMRRHQGLSLHVEHDGTVRRGRRTVHVEAHAASIDAAVLDTEMTVATHTNAVVVMGAVSTGGS